MYIHISNFSSFGFVANTLFWFSRLSGFLVFWLFAFLVIDAKEQPAGIEKDEIHGDQEGQENKQTQKKLRTKMVNLITLIDCNFSDFFLIYFQAKRRGKEVTLTLLISSIVSVTIVFICYHLQGNEPEIVNGQNVQQEVTSNESCSFWHITADEYCDDEANIVECGYDFKDCCDMENDRSLCKDCLCYIQEEEKTLLDEEFNKNCPHEMIYAWGDGICDLNLNNKENYFDVGDCCQENPNCMSFAYNTKYVECPENSCIQSNIFCILEELGDGICQDHNNGPFCQYDLGDCCSVPGNFTDCCCNCDCKKVNFVYDYDGFLNTHV